jgi:predicted nucleic acid-binding protein
MNDLLLPGAGRQRRSRSLGKIYRSCTYLHSDLVRLDSNQREYQKFVRTGSVVFTNLTHCLTLKPFDMSQPRRSLLLVSVESERANQIVSRSTGRICFCFLLSSHTNQDSSRARSAILQRMHEMLPHSFDRSTRLRCFNMAFDLRAERTEPFSFKDSFFAGSFALSNLPFSSLCMETRQSLRLVSRSLPLPHL